MRILIFLPLLLLLGCESMPGLVGSSSVWYAPLTMNGSLQPGDGVLEDGEYYDAYRVRVRSGDHLSIRHVAEAFDCYLLYIDPSGKQIENDDFGGEVNSQIDVTVEQSGTAMIIATSFYPENTGDYELTILVP